jgi:hypothetical protein
MEWPFNKNDGIERILNIVDSRTVKMDKKKYRLRQIGPAREWAIVCGQNYWMVV